MSRNWTVALVSLLTLTSIARAEDVRGVVTRVDVNSKELCLDGRGIGLRGTVIQLALPGDVQVIVGGQPAKLVDVVVGKRVRVTVQEREGKRVAVAVQVLGNALLPPPPPPPAGALLPPGPGAPPPPAPPADGFSGILRRTAPSEREITLATPGQDGKENYTTFNVPETARILRDGKPIKLEDLKEGENIVVAAENRNGKLTAAAIQVGNAPPAAAAASDSNKVARVRQVLKVLDAVLGMIEQK